MQVPIYQNRVDYEFKPTRAVEASKVFYPVGIDDAKESATKILTQKLPQIGQQIYETVKETFTAKKEDTPYEYEGFSNPMRGQLLEYGRTDAFRPAAEQNDGENTLDAVGRLDKFFVEKTGANAQTLSSYTDKNLLVQDYAVLRKEVAHIQQLQQQQIQRENFEQGAGHFLQTAALVRSPEALSSYMQANLEAAGQEAVQNGLSGEQWTRQKAFLSSQAVQHNIQAALTEGDVDAAQAVYTHFQDKLDEKDQALLTQQMAICRADKQAKEWVNAAQAACVNADGELEAEKLTQWVNQHSAEQTDSEKQAFAQALKSCLWEKRQAQLQREETLYSTLLDNAGATDTQLQTLLKSSGASAQVLSQASCWVHQLQQEKNTAPNCAAFTALQAKMMNGELSYKQLDRALQKEKITAADCLRLKRDFCRYQVKGVRVQERLLLTSVETFCQRSGLSAQTAQEASYFVLSAGPDLQQRVRAARELKQILTLQENKK